MAPIDWSEVGAVAAGAIVGTFIGYRVFRNRRPSTPRKRQLEVAALQDPARHALVLAFSAFFGCAIAEDLAGFLGREQPGGYFLAKYILAATIGSGNYLNLRHRGSALETEAQKT
jgi:hypothetical protein